MSPALFTRKATCSFWQGDRRSNLNVSSLSSEVMMMRHAKHAFLATLMFGGSAAIAVQAWHNRFATYIADLETYYTSPAPTFDEEKVVGHAMAKLYLAHGYGKLREHCVTDDCVTVQVECVHSRTLRSGTCLSLEAKILPLSMLRLAVPGDDGEPDVVVRHTIGPEAYPQTTEIFFSGDEQPLVFEAREDNLGRHDGFLGMGVATTQRTERKPMRKLVEEAPKR